MKRRFQGVRTAYKKAGISFLFAAFSIALSLMVSCAPFVKKESPPLKAAPSKAQLAHQLLEKAIEEFHSTENLKRFVENVKVICKEYPEEEACPKGWFAVSQYLFDKGLWKDVWRVANFFLERWPSVEESMRVRFFQLVSAVHLKKYNFAREIAFTLDEKGLSRTEKLYLKLLRAEIYYISARYEDAFEICVDVVRQGQEPFSSKCRTLIESTAHLFPWDKLKGYKSVFSDPRVYIPSALAYADDQASSGKLEKAFKVIKSLEVKDDPPVRERLEELKKMLSQVIEAEQDTLKIGVLLPEKGALSKVGQKILKSVFFAFSKTTVSREVLLTFEYTGESRASAVKAFFNLFSGGMPQVVIGPVSAEYIVTLAPHADMFKIPIIGITRVEGIAAKSQYVFRLHVSSSLLVDRIVRWARLHLKIKNFGVLYPRDGYGVYMRDLFWEAVKRYGGEVVAAKSYKRGRSDIVPEIKKMVGTYYMDVFEKEAEEKGEKLPPDFQPPPKVEFKALFIPEGAMRAAFIARELAYADVIGVQLLGPDLWHDERFLKIGENFVEGAAFADGFFAESQLPDVRKFVASFQEEYIDVPDTLTTYVVALSRFIISYIDKHSAGRQNLARALFEEKINVPGGTLTFDDRGELIHPVRIIAVEGGKFVELE